MNRQTNVTGIRLFKSRVAAKFFQLGLLGFLGALGFVPGLERLFGFTGFFGFIGVACLIESIHRVRHKN
jgi:hypothetical protein